MERYMIMNMDKVRAGVFHSLSIQYLIKHNESLFLKIDGYASSYRSRNVI